MWRMTPQPPPQSETPDRPLGDLLEEIKLSELTTKSDPAKISNCKVVASYNWLDTTLPTILVPGEISCPQRGHFLSRNSS
jgi:hypothetical protein